MLYGQTIFACLPWASVSAPTVRNFNWRNVCDNANTFVAVSEDSSVWSDQAESTESWNFQEEDALTVRECGSTVNNSCVGGG